MENKLLIASFAFCALLFWFFGKSCGDVVDTKAQQKIDSVVTVKETEKAIFIAAVNKVGEENDSLKAKNDTLNQDLATAKKKLAAAEAKAKGSIAKYEWEFETEGSPCDTVVSALKEVIAASKDVINKSDSVIGVQFQIIGVQKQVIQLQSAQLDSSYKRIDFMADINKKQDVKIQWANKQKGNFWKGVGAGVAAVITAILLTK